MKKLLFISTILLWNVVLHSQQLPVYSQYTENVFLINPAVAGSDRQTIYSLTNRIQWIGSEYSPHTESFSYQTLLKQKGEYLPIFAKKEKQKGPKKDNRVGLGGHIYNDKNVHIGRSGLQVAYAYHINLKNQNRLSLGLALNTFQYRLDKEDIKPETSYDPVLYGDKANSAFSFDAAAGAYFSSRDYFVGVSALQLSQSALTIGSKAIDDYQLKRHYFAVGGFNVNVNREYSLIPSVLLRTTENFKNFQTDFTCRLSYLEQIWIGMTIRTNRDIIGLISIRKGKLFITYGYEYTSNRMFSNRLGSHELTISMKMGTRKIGKGQTRK